MNRLILALDVMNEEKAIKIANETKEYLHAIKVGYPLVLSSGMDIVRKLSKIGDVICDFKVADIPNTNRLIVKIVKNHGARGIIVHGFVGHDSLRACKEEAGDMDVYVVAEMSHSGAEDFMIKYTDKIVELAKREGVKGIIAPANKIERLKYIRKIADNLKILSPGVGAQGGNAREAIINGADYVIVGRSIYNAKNPREVARKIHEEIRDL